MYMFDPERIYDLYFDTVYRVCFLYMKNSADAQDMAQETFLQMLRKPFNYESDEKTKAWLIVCASNLCKNHLKKWWRKKSVSLDEEIGNLENIQGINLNNEQSEILETVMSLDGKYSLPVYLYYYEGYSTGEIAKMTATKPSTVQTRLAKARRLLKMELE